MQKVSDADERIQLLMDIEQWKPAVEEIFATKRQDTEVLDELTHRAPPFVQDFIRIER